MEQLTSPLSDFTSDEVIALENYKNSGLASINRASESDVYQWFSLYSAGKTYGEVAQITNTKKDIILFYSEKGSWFHKRTTYYSELGVAVFQKYDESKLETANTVATMISALNRYFGGKFNQYLKTNDASIIEGLDTKLLAQYYKATESLDKMMTPTVEGNLKTPQININMNGVGKVTQTSDNTIDVEADESAKDREVGEILKSLAKLKKIRAAE